MTARVKAPTVRAAMTLCICTLAAATEALASPSATPVKHNSLKTCNQQADARNLNGAARSQYVKHCQSQTASKPAATPAPAAAAPKPAGK
ncbi:MAG TPA: PsiF family protein [Steroidobacteraceae bacterium]|jgi:hypothetical protein